MHLAIASGILSLGESPSAFGASLALIIIFFLLIGGLVSFLIFYVAVQSLAERRENLRRAREYDALHGS